MFTVEVTMSTLTIVAVWSPVIGRAEPLNDQPVSPALVSGSLSQT